MKENLFYQWLIVTASFIIGSIIASLILGNNISLVSIFPTILLSSGYGLALYNNKNEINKNK